MNTGMQLKQLLREKKRCKKPAAGSFYPVEVRLQQHAHSGGNVYAAVVFDLTEIKEMEEELQAREEQLKNITKTTRDAIIMIDEKRPHIFLESCSRKAFWL